MMNEKLRLRQRGAYTAPERRLYCASVGLVISFIAMLLLLNSPWPNLHYVAEVVEMFFAGCVCGLMVRKEKDEELFIASMMLPAMANYVLGALFVPACAALACFYYAGLYLGGESK